MIGLHNHFYKYIISPITLLFPIVIITAITGRDFDHIYVNPVFIVGMACVFLIMAVFYLMLCGGNKMKAAVAVAGLTNGVITIFFASIFDSGIFFIFAGFLIVIFGIITAMSMIVSPRESLFARKMDVIVSNNVGIDELRKIIESIQFPCVFMERNKNSAEKIVAFNASFADSFRLDRKGILGNSMDALLPIVPGMEHLKRDGEEWVIKRTVKGKQILLMFSPAAKAKEAAKIEVFDAIDLSTGLYVEGFLKYKARSDVESINRGKRKISVVLFKIIFPPEESFTISEDEKKLIFVIFGRIVMECIRVCDSAFRTGTGNDEVLLLMPDTPSSGASIVISRVYSKLKRTSAVECPSLSKVMLNYIDKDFIGGTDLPPYDKILEEMSVLIYRKNPELASAS
jgi:hypothetical protein